MVLADDIKLLAVDVDGTIVIDGRIVTPDLRRIFSVLRERGVVTALCTGRMPHWTAEVAEELDVGEYLICADGGHVLSRFTGEKLHYPAMEDAVLCKIADLVEGLPTLEVAAVGDDALWATDDLARQRAHWWGHRCEGIGDVRKAPSPVLLILFGAHEAMARASLLLSEELADDHVRVHAVESFSDYAQVKICDPEADKGVAAAKLVRHLGGGSNQILAFGDYLNDLGLIQTAGYSICPRNAHPGIRETASYTSAYSTEEGFVAEELKRVFHLV